VDWIIEPLQSRHVRTGFSCGAQALDDYLHRQALQNQKKKIGRTFVAVKPGETRVMGYFTLAAAEIRRDRMPPEAKLPRHPVPAILLARLAVDKSCQRRGAGSWLLSEALMRCLSASETIAAYAVFVHALDEAAVGFYKRFGFRRLFDNPHHMFLPLKDVVAAVE
jgi:GNAT superfamily N-acetyltransferase